MAETSRAASVAAVEAETVLPVHAPCCGDCRFFRGAKPLTGEQQERAARYGVVGGGECLRFPMPVRKQSYQWCGEFEARELAV